MHAERVGLGVDRRGEAVAVEIGGEARDVEADD